MFSEAQLLILDSEISKLLSKRVIVPTEHEPGEYISPIFLRDKKDGNFRMILNLKKLNKEMEYIKFKMETLSSILALVTKGCFFTKIDLKDAYYSIPVRDQDQNLLKFRHRGNLYKFTCLPNGLCHGPRKFTKLLKPPLSSLREQGVTIAAYLDDCLNMDQNSTPCSDNNSLAVSTLQKCGFTVHPEPKSCLSPTQEIEFIGFIINSIAMSVRLTQAKMDAIKELCITILNKSQPSIREVAKLIGKFTSSFPGVRFGGLHYRNLERCKTFFLRIRQGDFDKNMTLSKEAKSDIAWWRDNVCGSWNDIYIPCPSITIHSDASKSGWGAVIDFISTGGFLSAEEQEEHINVLELKAILFGLQSLIPHVFDEHVKIMCDNTTAVAAVNKKGSTKSIECDEIAKLIWEWGIAHNVWLSAAHVPGVLNVKADEESRKQEIFTEWMLDPEVFWATCHELDFFPSIDLFASRINTQLDNFVSYRPDPLCSAVDAFSIPWGELLFYAFPPFACLPKVIQKVRWEKASGLIIAPDWTSQAWYPVLRDISTKIIKLPCRSSLLSLPNRPGLHHPLSSLRLKAHLILH